jgi:hypothetical protein
VTTYYTKDTASCQYPTLPYRPGEIMCHSFAMQRQ